MKFLPHVYLTKVSSEEPGLQGDEADDDDTVVYTLLMWNRLESKSVLQSSPGEKAILSLLSVTLVLMKRKLPGSFHGSLVRDRAAQVTRRGWANTWLTNRTSLFSSLHCSQYRGLWNLLISAWNKQDKQIGAYNTGPSRRGHALHQAGVHAAAVSDGSW